MSEQQRSSLTVVIIAGAAIGLCCVGSFLGMMLFGVGSPLALLGVTTGSPPPPPIVSTAVPQSALLGAWAKGVPGITELVDAKAAAWQTVGEDSRRLVFRSNHSCELEELTSNPLAQCLTWRFVSRGNCEWSLADDQLTMKFGPGVQLTKRCGGDIAESALPAITVTSTVRYDEVTSRLKVTIGGETHEYAREP
ncbi:MAG: hypothetical protein ACO1OB_00325 [Archangium sp.]